MYINLRALVICAFCTASLFAAASSTTITPRLHVRQDLDASPHALLQLPRSKTIVVAGLLQPPAAREYKYQLTCFSAELKPSARSYRWIHEYPIAELTHNNEESIHVLFPLTMRDIRRPTMGPHVDSTKMTAIVKSFIDHTVYTATPSGHVVAVLSHPLYSRERILSLYSTDIREIPLHTQLDREETINALALSADSSLAAWATDWGNLGIVTTHKPFSHCKLKVRDHARCTAVAISQCKMKAACCYNTGELSRGEEIRTYCALFSIKNVPKFCPQLIQTWSMPDTVTTCMFLYNGKLLVGTTGKKLYLYD